MSKPKVVISYSKLDQSLVDQIKLTYPYGFQKHLITFKNIKNKFVSALPFETDDRYYLIKMTLEQAQKIMTLDDDFDKDGNLSEAAKIRLKGKVEEVKQKPKKKAKAKPKAAPDEKAKPKAKAKPKTTKKTKK